jgi:hypothetical protein
MLTNLGWPPFPSLSLFVFLLYVLGEFSWAKVVGMVGPFFSLSFLFLFSPLPY